MKQKSFSRVLALVLTVSFLLGGGTAATASAAESEGAGSSVSDTSLSELRALLNAASYSDYSTSDIFRNAPKATDEIVIGAEGFNADASVNNSKTVKVDLATGIGTVVGSDYKPKDGEVLGMFSPDSGDLAFNVDIPSTAKYSIRIEYISPSSIVDAEGENVYTDKSGSIERILKIDDTVPFSEARYLVMTKTWVNLYTIKMGVVTSDIASDGTITRTYTDVTPYIEKAEKCGIEYKVEDDKSAITLKLPEGGWTSENLAKLSAEDLRFFTTDVDNNEIRCSMERVPELRSYECKDIDGFYTESFEFLLEKGERTISLEAKSRGVVITKITLFPQKIYDSYNDVKESYTENGYTAGSDVIKFEAEFPYATSSQTIYPIEDSSSAATSPSDTKRTVLNTIGGEKWQTSGQWVRYNFSVNSDGLYQIVTRFRQNVNDGMFSSRVLSIYSHGLEEGAPGYYNGIPFEEAKMLRFLYDSGWQVSPLKYSKETKDAKGNSVWNDVELEFYFKAGVTYTIEFEIALGDMGSIVSEVSDSLANINDYYLNILKLTGADPDKLRDYGFYRVMPDTMQGLIIESRRLYNISNELISIIGEKSSNVATLEKVADLLQKMGTDEDNVARYMEQLKTYIGTLGTWINDNKTQPLEFDYILIQSAEKELPKASAGFFQAVWHEIMKFIQSFFRNYDRMGATSEQNANDQSVEVWLAKGRDQTQVIRNLINNDFTPSTGYLVDLKLVAGGALLPSILAGSGPDVYIGVSEGNIINYAIRGALVNIENFEGFYDLTSQYLMEHKTIDDYIGELTEQKFILNGKGTSKVSVMSSDGVEMFTINYNSDGSGETRDRNGKHVNGFTKEGWLYETGSTFSGETYSYKNVLDANGEKVANPNAQFNEAAMYVLGLPDADNIMHYYGLPEEQNFSMMFVRNDILANLGIEIPKTWDDIQSAIPVLQANNMAIGMSNDAKIFIYQRGSTLFADDGMRINLDSNVALDSFEYMCNLYTMYSFPYTYNFSNRFRTGEMPIGIASYNGTYNQLIVFATEIRGLWSFYPIPGESTVTVDEDGNKVETINNVAVASVSAISMINGCENKTAAWEFMKWHVSADCQVNYSNEMVAILGDSAKYATANITALESMPWTTEEYRQLSLQFNNLASIPNYPGSYIIGRYTKFAFLAAYEDSENPVDSLQQYIVTINKEITRKRSEFGLETLEIGETLASKRLAQATELLNSVNADYAKQYADEIATLRAVMEIIGENPTFVTDEHIDELRAAAAGLRATQYSEFFQIADYIETVADSLKSYQRSY